MNAAPSLRDALCATLSFAPHGDAAGNVAVGRGSLDGQAVRMALVENRFASGAIGCAEAERLVALLRVVARERAPLVLFLDSAGAKVSEGLRALGAFRALYRAGLDAALAGAPVCAVLGRNCFGGSSMFAHLAARRLFSPETRLAMSGPAILAAAAGADPLDEVFRATAEAVLSPAARARASPANGVWSPEMDLRAWLREALARSGDAALGFQRRHDTLAARIADRPPDPPWESLRRRDLERLFPVEPSVRESQGLLEGMAEGGDGEVVLLGLVGNAPLGAVRAWRFADAAWRLARKPPQRLEVLLDCASHAPRLEDEKVVLTEYIVDMSAALATLAARGTRVGLTVLGRAGGGVYVALASPASRVAAVHGAEIQVLPGAAVAAILGESHEGVPSFDEYREAGVADEQFKLGIVPGAA